MLCPRSWPRLQACHCPSLRGNAPLAISTYRKRALRAHASGLRPSTKWKLLVCSRVLAFEFSLLTLPPAAGLSGPASSALPLASTSTPSHVSVHAICSRALTFSLSLAAPLDVRFRRFNSRKRLRIARGKLSVTHSYGRGLHHRISLTGARRACVAP